MRKLIIFFTVLLVCVFSIYPPFKGAAKKPEQLQTIQATQNTIEVIEQKNDERVFLLNQNVSTIDSLNKVIRGN